MLFLTVVFFLSLALFSFFALHQKKQTETAVQEVLEHYTVGQIYAEYQSHNRTLWVFVVAGIALTGGFAVTYFAGTEINPQEWEVNHWIFAGIGILVTVAITVGQKQLYQNISNHIVAFFIVIVILSFVYMSEISTQGERSEALMKDRSLSSPTLQAVLDGIRNNTAEQETNPYASRIAEAERLAGEHRSKLAECETKYKTEKRKIKCREYERAKMNGYKNQAQVYKDQAQTLSKEAGNTIIKLVEEGKKLEHNEENYAAFIKFIKTAFSVSAPSALNFVAFILVNAFEVLFHFIGVRTGILKEALLRSGYNFTPEPPTPEDINAKIKYKREIQRAKWTEKTRNYARKLEQKNRKNRSPSPTPETGNQSGEATLESAPNQSKQGLSKNTDTTVPDTVPPDRSGEKKRKHTSLTGDTDGNKNQGGNRTDNTQGTGTGNKLVSNTEKPTPLDRTDQIRTEGKEKAWFPKILYRVVQEAIIDQRIKPTVRPTHTVVSEGLKEGLYDQNGKHRHYTKPETQEITVFILEKLFSEGVLIKNQQGGIGKPKYVLHPDYTSPGEGTV